MIHRFLTLAVIIACRVFFNDIPFGVAGEPEIITLWPGTAPGEGSEIPTEGEFTEGGKKFVAQKPIYLVTNVSKPELAVYRPDPANNTGAAIIICPGGAHRLLAYDLEGTEIAQWLNTIGITGIVLKYRVPSRNPDFKCLAAMQDAQRAISVVRTRSKGLGIDASKIGILGVFRRGRSGRQGVASVQRSQIRKTRCSRRIVVQARLLDVDLSRLPRERK